MVKLGIGFDFSPAWLQASSMQSPWESDFRTRPGDFEDARSERSTSAPPPETALNLIRNGGSRGGHVSLSRAL